MAFRDIGVRTVVRNLGSFLSNMERYNEAIGRSEARTRRFAERARAAGTSLAILGGAVTAVGAVSLRTFGAFEQQMARVQAVSGATATQFTELNAVAEEMGRTTQFSAVQAAGALQFMSQAGLSVQTQIAALPEVLNLAAAAQLDMAQSADIVTNVMAAFGLEVDQLTRANDTLVTAFTSANTNLAQLAQALKFAGPVASAAGVSFEETAASLALMGNAGIQASMAGTGLRGAITRLLNPSGEAQRVIQRLGLTVLDAQGNMLPLVEIVQQLESSGLTAADAMTLFGQRAGPAMLALLEQGSGALRNLTAEMLEAGGVTESIAERQLDTFTGSMTLLRSAVEGVQISIGRALAPSLRSLAESLQPILSIVAAWIERNPRLTLTVFALGAVVAALGAGLLFIGLVAPGVVAGFGVLTGAVGLLSVAFGGLSIAMGPITLIVLAIAAAIAAGIAIWRNWERIIEFVRNRVNDFIRMLNRLIDVVSTLNPLLLGLRFAGFEIPDIPEFAHGGRMRRSGPALVGERGPEFVTLPAGAQVTPISRNNTFNVTANYTRHQDPNSIRADMEAIAMMAAQ